MKEDYNADISNIVEFLKRFPKIQLFYELNMKHFMHPEKAEKTFTA